MEHYIKHIDVPVTGSTKESAEVFSWMAFWLYTVPVGSTMGGLFSFIISLVMAHIRRLCTCLAYGSPSAKDLKPYNFESLSEVSHVVASDGGANSVTYEI
jgi:hypothetical protein